MDRLMQIRRVWFNAFGKRMPKSFRMWLAMIGEHAAWHYSSRAGGGASILPCKCDQPPSLRRSNLLPVVERLMVEIIRKPSLPRPEEVPPGLRAAATAASDIKVREPRPVGFSLLFTSQMHLLEPVVGFLHERAIQ